MGLPLHSVLAVSVHSVLAVPGAVGTPLTQAVLLQLALEVVPAESSPRPVPAVVPLASFA